MFANTPAFSGFSVDSLEQAARFYGEILGLTVNRDAMGLHLTLQGGTQLFVYEKPDHTPASYTILNFVVDAIDAAVADLTSAGIVLERYPDAYQDEKGITRGKAANMGPDIAWFKDPAGNILAVLQN